MPITTHFLLNILTFIRLFWNSKVYYNFFTVGSNVKLSVFVHDESGKQNLGQIKFLI